MCISIYVYIYMQYIQALHPDFSLRVPTLNPKRALPPPPITQFDKAYESLRRNPRC